MMVPHGRPARLPILPTFVVRRVIASRGALSCALAAVAALVIAASEVRAAAVPPATADFIEKHCANCHDENQLEGGLDLASLEFSPENPRNFATWVKVFERASSGEMPPKKKPRPPAGELKAFVGTVASTLEAAEAAKLAGEGRATRRRLNRYEYENTLRDLLQAPWLQIKEGLPEDGEAFRFNKVGDALDVSHVNMARYLAVAEDALRQVMARQIQRPETKTRRFYTREQRTFTGPMIYSVFNTSPERSTFPVLRSHAQPDVRSTKAPLTVGAADPVTRDEEAMGIVASSYEPIEPRFDQFKAPMSGHYRLRLSAYAIWVGPGKPRAGKPLRWWTPDLDDVTAGRRPEPVALYAEIRGRQMRRIGAFDFSPEPTVAELDVDLVEGETIRPDAVRLFRSRPPAWVNPLATREGQPGVAFQWLEVQGPLIEEWPTAGHRLLFGNLPLRKNGHGGIEVVTADPKRDADRLMRGFLTQAYREPVTDADVSRFTAVVDHALASGLGFADAMISGYTAVLCSPKFLYLEETPGRLDDDALATRLAYFLTNSAPDTELRQLAARHELHRPEVLDAQTERLLDGPKSQRFVNAFLDYWLDLRRIQATAPDSSLYNDYYLDDALVDSALEETQLFFAELLRRDLPARCIVEADFDFVNERLTTHYGLPPVDGVKLRRVALPPESPRGGLLTQAAVLKVTANGTSTSPVVRGAWVMERILGMPPAPPPPSVPAIEPDTRGATTIRQLLEKHRADQGCASCHAKIDPAGFALENFDVLGAWRDKYRAVSEGVPPATGIGKNGQKFAFHFAQPVDPAGELWDGREFSDIRQLKQLLAADEVRIARNLARQLAIYATGSPVRFSDRVAVDRILEAARPRQYGVRSLVHALVQSDLFLNK